MMNNAAKNRAVQDAMELWQEDREKIVRLIRVLQDIADGHISGRGLSGKMARRALEVEGIRVRARKSPSRTGKLGGL